MRPPRRAALVGGTTTLIEMVCPSRAEEPLAAFELWKSKAEGKSVLRFHVPHGRDAITTRWPKAS